jgi:transposase
MAADGVSKSEIARRLGIDRRTVKRLVEASEAPRYSRAPAGSILDPLEPVMRRLLADWSDIKAPRVTEILRDDFGYSGSVDLVRKPPAVLRPRSERPAQKNSYRLGQVLQVDWAEMPTRPRIAGRERRVYALICSLPFSGAATAQFSFDMTIESFLEGHARLTGLGAFRASASTTTSGRRSPSASASTAATSLAGMSGSRSCAATTPFTPPPAHRRRRARRAPSRSVQP